MIESLWVEKYRPKTLDDVILDEATKQQFKNFIETQSLPHLLLVGKPGTGKTTIALVLKDHLIKADEDVLFLNASDSRGINTVRSIILEFLKSAPLESPLKLVILDEADYLTPESFAALRNPIENKEFNVGGATRFIFTANYINKIPDFIKSRCIQFHFGYMSLDTMQSKLEYILQQENIEYDSKQVQYIASTLYPDFRAMINTIQRAAINNKFTSESFDELVRTVNDEVADKLVTVIDSMSGAAQNVFQQIISTRDYLRDKIFSYEIVCEKILNKLEVTKHHNYEAYVIVNRYLNTMDDVLSKEHHLNSMLFEIMIAKTKVGEIVTI